MYTPSNRIYRVWSGSEITMTGTLAQCYEAYPILATKELDSLGMTSPILGIWLERIEW